MVEIAYIDKLNGEPLAVDQPFVSSSLLEEIISGSRSGESRTPGVTRRRLNDDGVKLEVFWGRRGWCDEGKKTK